MTSSLDLRSIRRATGVAVNLLTGLVAVGVLGGVGWCAGLLPRRRAQKDLRAIWALHELREAQMRFAAIDRDGDGRHELGTLQELDRAGVLGEKLRAVVYGADHCYEVFLQPAEPARWLAIAHPLRRGVQAYAYDGGGAVHASDDDIAGGPDCVIPAGCWQLGK